MSDWYTEFQKSQPNKFNEELIYGLREKDKMLDYLIDVCKALEAIPYIKYIGYEEINDESKFKERPFITINDSRLSLLIFKFKITFKNEVEYVELPLYIPKWINKYYFILNGTKYYPIYQNVDSSTYNTKDSIILKSLLMPIILIRDNKKIIDIDGNEYNGHIFLVNLFKHKSNILYYYFATKGFKETIEFFGYNKKIIVTKDTSFINNSKYIVFPINKTYNIVVSKKKFESDKNFKYFVCSVVDVFNKKTMVDKIYSNKYWMLKLGAIYTKNVNNQFEKAETVLISFRRILDNRTRKNLRIAEEDKNDIFSLIKWMVNNYSTLMKKDNLSLLNKRMRMSEYLITPFVKRMSNNTYRILNSKVVTMNKIKGILKPSPMTLISDLQVAELLRYNGAVNDDDLFNCALKFSNRGPSSLGEGKKKTVSIIYKGIHQSHLGRLSLNSGSNGDPGMNGIESPFIQTDGFYYSSSSEIDEIDEEQEE